MKKTILIISALILTTVASVVFIKNGNDHKECNNSVQYSTDTNGNKITIETHNCKEKYNF